VLQPLVRPSYHYFFLSWQKSLLQTFINLSKRNTLLQHFEASAPCDNITLTKMNFFPVKREWFPDRTWERIIFSTRLSSKVLFNKLVDLVNARALHDVFSIDQSLKRRRVRRKRDSGMKGREEWRHYTPTDPSRLAKQAARRKRSWSDCADLRPAN